MLRQSLYVAEEIQAARLGPVIGGCKDRLGLPQTHQADGRRKARHQDECLAIGQMPGDVAAGHAGRKGGDHRNGLPKRAQPPRHQLFLGDQRHQPLIGRGDETKRHHREYHPDDEAAVRLVQDRKNDERDHGSRREEDKETAIAQAERIQKISREPENKRKVDRNGSQGRETLIFETPSNGAGSSVSMLSQRPKDRREARRYR